MLRPFAACLLLLLTSCAPVAWTEPPAGLPTSWRHYQLFTGPHALVLARDASAAAEGHRLAETAAATLTAELGQAPPRGLVLALSAEDPLPIADPAAYVEAFGTWQRAVTGRAAPPPSFSPQKRPGASQPEIDPALAMHLVGTGIPKDDHQLDLPPELVAASAFVALLPTDSCLQTTCGALVDAACKAEGISTLTLLAAAVIVGHPATLMQKEMAELRTVALHEAWLPALDANPARLAELRQRLGLPASGSPPVDDPGQPLPPELAAQVREIETQATWPAADGSGFVVRRRPPAELQAHLTEGPWQVVVDLGPSHNDLVVHTARSGRAYLPFSCPRVLPTQADAAGLDALLRKQPHAGILLVADDPERAAALVAVHAFYVRGLSAAAAVESARRCGGAALVTDLAQVFAKQPASK